MKTLLLFGFISIISFDLLAQEFNMSRDHIYTGIGVNNLNSNMDGFDYGRAPNFHVGYEKKIIYFDTKPTSGHILLFDLEYIKRYMYSNGIFKDGVFIKAINPYQQLVDMRTNELIFLPKYGYYKATKDKVIMLFSTGPYANYIVDINQSYYNNGKISERIRGYNRFQYGIDVSMSLENRSLNQKYTGYGSFTLGTRFNFSSYSMEGYQLIPFSIYLRVELLSRNNKLGVTSKE